MHRLFAILFQAAPKDIKVQYFRYIVVGGTVFILDLGMLYVFTDILGIYYLISAAISFLIALSIHYYWSISWIFSTNASRFGKKQEFVYYGIIAIVSLFLTEALLYTGTDLLHFHYLISKIVTAGFVFSVNFLARRYLLFK